MRPALFLTLAALGCSSNAANVNAAAASICDAGRGATSTASGFTRWSIDDAASGPAYVSVGDVNGDGRLDLVVSSIGAVKIDGSDVSLSPGRVTAYLQGDGQGGGLGCWHAQPIASEEAGLYFPNQTTLDDIDGDGDLDLVVPSGFFVCSLDKNVKSCGGMTWFENPTWKRHDVVRSGDTRFYHRAIIRDFDGDGVKDLVTVAESTAGAKARWFHGTSDEGRFDPNPREIGDGGGSFPFVADVDRDGDLDLLSAEFFVAGGSFAWFERTGATSFVRHEISSASETGKGFQLELVPNLLGDGRTLAIGTNHTNVTSDPASPESAVWLFEPTSDVRAPWTKTKASTGVVSRPSEGTKVQGAPGVFAVGDIDGDGDLDIALAGDGDQRTYWLEQKDARFEMHVIERSLGQAAGAHVVDLDRDGKSDLVFTGYEDGKVYVYTRN